MPFDKNRDVTLEGVAKALSKTLAPFYKGFPDPNTAKPEFRRTLTGEETHELLTAIHTILTSIRIQLKAEHEE